MRFSSTVVPTGRGEWKFDDGKVVGYLDFADPDGGGADRATVAREAEGVDGLELFKPAALDFETYTNDKGARKLRTFGPSKAAGLAKVA